MRTILAILLWFILLSLCWPLAVVLLVLLPFLWLVTLPFRLVGFTLGLVFKLVSSILLFPFRILGMR